MATINVSTPSQLYDAVSTTNGNGGGDTIVLADGTYTINVGQAINVPNVTVRSATGIRENVIVQGDAMSAGASVTHCFLVDGANFTVQDLTMQRTRYHCVQVRGENSRHGTILRNCVLRDSYEMLLKLSNDPDNAAVHGDNGLVEDCLFEYSAGIGPQWYIGGVDCLGSQGWTVRDNVFRNIISPDTTVAGAAIQFWDGSANNTVERNKIINCDRAITFGLGTRGNTGGIIRNNMAYHAAGNGTYADVQIQLETSPSTQVYNNTIYRADTYPNAIEYRWAGTTGVLIVNTLTNKAIALRDSATGTVQTNITNAQAAWFLSVATGDLHLASSVAAVVGQGQSVSGLTDDYDAAARTGAIDIGADQYGSAPVGTITLSVR